MHFFKTTTRLFCICLVQTNYDSDDSGIVIQNGGPSKWSVLKIGLPGFCRQLVETRNQQIDFGRREPFPRHSPSNTSESSTTQIQIKSTPNKPNWKHLSRILEGWRRPQRQMAIMLPLRTRLTVSPDFSPNIDQNIEIVQWTSTNAQRRRWLLQRRL